MPINKTMGMKIDPNSYPNRVKNPSGFRFQVPIAISMYNRLKTMVNQVCNLGSTKWDDHEIVKVILRSLVFRNPTQVQLIRGDPRYKQMSPEEVMASL
jgi:hypothetical protein